MRGRSRVWNPRPSRRSRARASDLERPVRESSQPASEPARQLTRTAVTRAERSGAILRTAPGSARTVQPAVFNQPPFADHALLDSGGGEKLERFGEVVLRRPDPQALWRKRLGERSGRAPTSRFVRESDRGGRWEARGRAPASRAARARMDGALRRARLRVRPTPFKHVGLFPEQAANWELVGAHARRRSAPSGRGCSTCSATRAPRACSPRGRLGR